MQKVGFGVIGAGLWGENHAETYATHPFSELVAVCDINPAKAKQIAEKYGAKRCYTNYEDLVTDAEVQAVGIATPDFAHHGPAVAAAKAGKHILVEKPLATSVQEAEEIVSEAKKSGVKLMVDFHNRWNPVMCQAKEAMEKGELGKLMLAYIRLSDTIYVPTEMLSWAAKSTVAWFIGSHAIDLACWFFDDLPQKVYAVSRSEVLKNMGIETPDFYETVLEFKKGGVAVIENCWILHNSLPTVFDFKLELVGSQGTIFSDISGNRCLEKMTSEGHKYGEILVAPKVYGRTVGFAVESIKYFVECVYYDKEPIVTGEHGLINTKIIHALIESCQKGEPIPLSF